MLHLSCSRATLFALLGLGVAAGPALAAPAQEPRFVNFHITFPADLKLQRVINGTVDARGDIGYVKTPYTGTAIIGVADAARQIRRPAARLTLRGTAGAPRPLRLRWTAAQLAAVRRQARRKGRSSVLLIVSLKGTPEGASSPIRRSRPFRVRLR